MVKIADSLVRIADALARMSHPPRDWFEREPDDEKEAERENV